MILVTGANGLLGSYVCRQLLETGKSFRGLIRKNSKLDLLKSIPSEHLIEGDILDELSLDEAMEGVKSIIHCAAVISFAPSDKELMYEVNVVGTRNLVNQALKHKVHSFIHVSSVGAIAVNNNEEFVDGSIKWPGSSSHTYYGDTKYQAELELFRAGEEGLAVQCFNPSIILGPGDWTKSSTRLFKYVYDENKFFTDGLINYVDIRDLVDLLIMALERDGTKERYIVSAGSTTYKDFFGMVAKHLNKKAPSIKASKFAVSMSVFLSWIGSLFLGRAPLITKETARNSSRRINYDNSKTKKEFEFEFRKLDQTLSWVAEELLDEGYSLK